MNSALVCFVLVAAVSTCYAQSTQYSTGSGSGSGTGTGTGSTSKACDNTQCGCWFGWCWTYLLASSRNDANFANYWWCYTQTDGVAHGQQQYKSCVNHSDCTTSMHCGNDVILKGANCTVPATMTCQAPANPANDVLQ